MDAQQAAASNQATALQVTDAASNQATALQDTTSCRFVTSIFTKKMSNEEYRAYMKQLEVECRVEAQRRADEDYFIHCALGDVRDLTDRLDAC